MASGPSTKRKAVAVATALAVGLLVPHLPVKAMLGVGAGGIEAVHIMNRDMDRLGREQRANGWVIYVSRLEREAAPEADKSHGPQP